MAGRTVEELARVLRGFRELRERVEGYRSLTGEALRRIATGEPLPVREVEAMAAERGIPGETVEEVVLSAERGREGTLVGIAGLTLNPSPHRLVIGDRTLHTWCAWDGLFLAPILGSPARLESTSPGDGADVRVDLTPLGVERVEPESAVLSVVMPRVEDVPRTADAVQALFCHYVHFFVSREAASEWVPSDLETAVLSVEEGFHLGELVYGDLFAR